MSDFTFPIWILTTTPPIVCRSSGDGSSAKATGGCGTEVADISSVAADERLFLFPAVVGPCRNIVFRMPSPYAHAAAKAPPKTRISISHLLQLFNPPSALASEASESESCQDPCQAGGILFHVVEFCDLRGRAAEEVSDLPGESTRIVPSGCLMPSTRLVAKVRRRVWSLLCFRLAASRMW